MTTTASAFAGDIPKNYDTYMVPMIFQPYAEDMARRLQPIKPKDLLEIAAGTGVLTRAMAATLGPETRLTITDLSQAMLDTAMARQGADSRIAWQQADGLALPFEDDSFDVVTCQFGVMFFPDKVRGYSEACRVLRPGGCFVFNVWDRIENNAFVSVLQRKLEELFPSDPPRFMERLPHGYSDLEAIDRELHSAGFATTAFETVNEKSRAASALDAAKGYCLGSPLGPEIEARAPGQLFAYVDKSAEALEKHFGSGPIEGEIRAHVITATR